MTSLAGGGNGHPTLKFTGIGSTVGGTVIEATDIQERDYATKEPKVFPKTGDPIMQVRVVLEQPDGSRGNFYVTGKGMKDAARKAIQDAGAEDLEEMAYFEMTRTGGQGKAGSPYTYEAKFVPFEPPF